MKLINFFISATLLISCIACNETSTESYKTYSLELERCWPNEIKLDTVQICSTFRPYLKNDNGLPVMVWQNYPKIRADKYSDYYEKIYGVCNFKVLSEN